MKRFLVTMILGISYVASLLFINLNFAVAAGLDCTRTDLTAKEQLECGACGAAGNQDNCNPPGAANTLSDTITTIINILSVVVGIVAVIMIIIAGFRYITSGGNAERTKNARNTILYALIGLVIVALAQIIVKFVLNNTANSTSGSANPPASSNTTPVHGSGGTAP